MQEGGMVDYQCHPCGTMLFPAEITCPNCGERRCDKTMIRKILKQAEMKIVSALTPSPSEELQRLEGDIISIASSLDIPHDDARRLLERTICPPDVFYMLVREGHNPEKIISEFNSGATLDTFRALG